MTETGRCDKKITIFDVFGLKNVLKNYFWAYKILNIHFSYVKLYFNYDSDVIFPKKLTKNWPKWSNLAIFVIF